MARDSVSKEPEKGPSTLSQVSRVAGASKATPGGHPDMEQTGRACWLTLKIEGFVFCVFFLSKAQWSFENYLYRNNLKCLLNSRQEM